MMRAGMPDDDERLRMAKAVGEVLRQARARRGLAPEEVAKALACEANAVTSWEEEGVLPHLGRLGRLATLLEIPLGDLAGLFDGECPIPHQWERVGRAIKTARERKGLDAAAAAQALGVSEKALGWWEIGNGLPQTWRMPQVAKILGWHLGDLDAILGAPSAPSAPAVRQPIGGRRPAVRHVPPERLARAQAALDRCLAALLALFPSGSLPGGPPWVLVRPGTLRWSREGLPLGGVTLRVEDDLAGSVEWVLTVLVHRLVHLALARRGFSDGGVGYAGGHSREFTRLAAAVGLEPQPGKRMSTGATRASGRLRKLFAEFALEPEEVLLGEPGAVLRRFGTSCHHEPGWRESLLPVERDLLRAAAPDLPAGVDHPAASKLPPWLSLGRRIAGWVSRGRRRVLEGARDNGQRGRLTVLDPPEGWDRVAGFPAPRLRLRLERDETPPGRAYPLLLTDEDCAACLWRLLAEFDCEALAALYLDTEHRLIGGLVAHVGIFRRAAVEPRRVLAAALLTNAWGMAVGHNHQVRPWPSALDRNFTYELRSASKVLGIELVGHYVVTASGFGRAE